MILKIKKLVANARVPTKGTPQSAGFDLFSLSDLTIGPHGFARVSTGIAMQPPPGLFGMIRPRSSAFSKGLLVSGTIDEDYTGEIFLQIWNLTGFPIVLEKNKSYAQLILVSYNANVQTQEVEELAETQRGEKGFGSTGNS